MSTRWGLRCAVAAIFAWLSLVQAAEPNPKIMSYKLPKQLTWARTDSGALQANLTGDPSKPGLYVILVKWEPHRMSRPHFHPNDRFVTVVSGTWWAGTGPKYDESSTYPLPAGSFATHFAKEIHYDGAKDEECILQIVGMGPATSTPAEIK